MKLSYLHKDGVVTSTVNPYITLQSTNDIVVEIFFNDGLPPLSGPVGCLFLCEAALFHWHPFFNEERMRNFQSKSENHGAVH